MQLRGNNPVIAWLISGDGCKAAWLLDYELTTGRKSTTREAILAEMKVVVLWRALIALIDTRHPKTSKRAGRPPYPTATMRRLAGIELFRDRLLDRNAILTCQHLLQNASLVCRSLGSLNSGPGE
jgi:transposase, IS5 family